MTMPRMRHTKAFERNPLTEFEFFLAEKLKRSVDEMRKSMSHEEFIGWYVYYRRIAQREELEMKKAQKGMR